MALLKCHECGNEVSSEAKTCPKCGAKVKKPTSDLVKIFFVVVGLGLIASFIAPHETLNSGGSSSPQVKGTSAPPELAWHYSTAKDGMSGKDIAFAETKSLNKQDLHFPYGPGIAATLTMRKHPRSGKNVYVSLDKGQILCRSYESCTIMIRFDDRAASKYSAIGPSDGSTDVVFVQNYAKFFAELRKSKDVLIELPMYQDGNRSWAFNVDGLTW